MITYIDYERWINGLIYIEFRYVCYSIFEEDLNFACLIYQLSFLRFLLSALRFDSIDEHFSLSGGSWLIAKMKNLC